MTVLVVDEDVRQRIAEAIARARLRPLTLEEGRRIAMPWTQSTITLDDKAEHVARRTHEPEAVEIAMGYLCAISFEEQPLGLCRHLSISVPTPGRLPSEEATRLLLDEFGMAGRVAMTWVEEFAPGRHAVNMVAPEVMQ